MNGLPTKTARGTDCSTPGGHRYDANGRCEWCDAERRFHLHIDGVGLVNRLARENVDGK